jgi:enoyl-CoA hydratase
VATTYVTVTHRDPVAILRLESDSAGVWLTPALEAALQAALDEAEHDPGVRVILLTAASGPCVVGRSGPGVGPEGALALGNCSKPLIAAFPGDLIGIGLEWSLACDLRVVGKNARLGLPQVSLGELPDGGGTQRLPRLIGPTRALHMLLTGDTISSEQGLEQGLITLVAPDDDPCTAALALADRIAATAPVAAAYVKEAVQRGMDLPLVHGLQMEADLNFLLQTTTDRSEGLTAFFARRPPRFTGE